MRIACSLVLAVVPGLLASCAARPPTAIPTVTPRMVPLATTLPVRGYDGSWHRHADMRGQPGVEDHAEGPLPPFLVPAGTRNLALGRRVTCSDLDPILGRPSMVTDGLNLGTDDNLFEMGPGPQWVQIDLGAPCSLQAILIWHSAGFPDVAWCVAVQVSDDPAFRAGVTTLFNNDPRDVLGLGRGADPRFICAVGTKPIHAKGIRARHVRCWSNGNSRDDQNRYVEVEVHGLPGQ